MHKANLTRPRMHGLALPSVLVMLLLCGWLALHAWRSLWLNELLLQARADALHTQNWADATLLAALDDVLQRNSDTASNTASNTAAQRYRAGSDTDRHVFIPTTAAQLEMLRQRLGNDDCRAGLCAPAQPLSWLAKDRQQRWSSGMPVVFDNVASTQSNSTRYWIEIFLQVDAQDQAQLNTQNDTPTAPVWVYRITAMATGLKSAAPKVLQAIWLQPAAPDVGVQTKTDVGSEVEAGAKAQASSEAQPLAKANAAPPLGRWISWTVWHDPP